MSENSLRLLRAGSRREEIEAIEAELARLDARAISTASSGASSS